MLGERLAASVLDYRRIHPGLCPRVAARRAPKRPREKSGHGRQGGRPSNQNEDDLNMGNEETSAAGKRSLSTDSFEVTRRFDWGLAPFGLIHQHTCLEGKVSQYVHEYSKPTWFLLVDHQHYSRTPMSTVVRNYEYCNFFTGLGLLSDILPVLVVQKFDSNFTRALGRKFLARAAILVDKKIVTRITGII